MMARVHANPREAEGFPPVKARLPVDGGTAIVVSYDSVYYLTGNYYCWLSCYRVDPPAPPVLCVRRASLLRRDGGGDVVSIHMHKGGRSMFRIEGAGGSKPWHTWTRACMLIVPYLRCAPRTCAEHVDRFLCVTVCRVPLILPL